MKKIRTRYAPSPTGYLHVGGARTALFSYLFAKHYSGDFIVRIEDTDVARNVEGGEASQIDNLEWLGIFPDESPRKPNEKYGPYRQTEKLDRYNELINKLIVEGKAYKAYDSTEELDQQKQESDDKKIPSFRYDRNWLKISDKEKARRDMAGEYTVRLSLKENYDYSWKDIVRGNITINTSDIGDWVIKKRNGFPTYNFAVVVDDHDMEISHVLRGEEHITNTPKQLAVYDALGWDQPEFGHMTLITNMTGQKLSKRDTTLKQFIEDYKLEGYIPEAVTNFLALLGWTHPKAKEVMPLDELITSFDPQRLSKSPSKFDIKKMNWFSKEYMKNKSNIEIIDHLDTKHHDKDWLEVFTSSFKVSAATYKELQTTLNIYNDKSVKPMEKNEVIKTFETELNKVSFTSENIQEVINKTKEITGESGKNLFMPIRHITTYHEHGPELAKAIFLVGEDLVKARLK